MKRHVRPQTRFVLYMHKFILFFICFQCQFKISAKAEPAIYVQAKANAMETYAARELQRYVYLLSGSLLPLQQAVLPPKANGFLIEMSGAKTIVDLGEEGYALKNEKGLLTIRAATSVGCLYGVYGLLEDHYGVGFYLGDDVLPQKKTFYLPMVDEVKKPLVKIRGFLPWTNFPQSATVYSWEDWRFIIDQAAKMRMNFIQVHNYNGEQGHNEPFHNFRVRGHLSRVWMPTAKTGHGWNCKPFAVDQFRFGASDLFDDYDFGSDAALHNEPLSNEMVFAKGVSLFQRVIAYAHTRGVKIGLGLDIDLILPEYKTTADDPEVIEARMQQVMQDYPDLDYLFLYISELINNKPEKLALWKRVFDGMYAIAKEKHYPAKMAVAGWGLSKEIADALPADVIAAPISHYSDGFEPGSMYGNREYWGCPWMERDFSSSQYYYPYNMHLSNTIKAWKARSKNMTGFYTLTWRITDAIDPKISFVAKAAWDDQPKINTAFDVYRDYAIKRYGSENADLANIINENEPISCNDAECQPTGLFTGKAPEQSGYLLNMRLFGFKSNSQTSWCIGNRYSTIRKAAIEKREDADSCIAWVEDSAFVHFAKVDFGAGMDTFLYATATANSHAAIDVHADSLNGRLLCTIKIPESGGWHNWQVLSAPMRSMHGIHDVYVLFKGVVTSHQENEKALQQLAIIKKSMQACNNKQQRRNLSRLKARIEAAHQHAQLNLQFPSVSKASDLQHAFNDWVSNFLERVTDISSLGNVQSIQNRYVQERYLEKEKQLLDKAAVKFPTAVGAKGTKHGAMLRWHNNQQLVSGFFIYANGQLITPKPLTATDSSFVHQQNGFFHYQIAAIAADGTASELSPTSSCYAGTADSMAPQIILVSPPSVVQAGAAFILKVRLLDNRLAEHLSVMLHYRKAGTKNWKQMNLKRKKGAVFMGALPCPKPDLMDYFLIATDGKNQSRYPEDDSANSSLVVEAGAGRNKNLILNVAMKHKTMNWMTPLPMRHGFIKVYRSQTKAKPVAADYLTFLPINATRFTDNGFALDGSALKGTYFYWFSTITIDGVESALSTPLAIDY
jgi:Carbohydrate binding module (family 6)